MHGKFRKRLRKFLLWAASGVLALSILLVLLLFAGMHWLHGDSGQAFMQREIARVLEKTPYRIGYTDLILLRGDAISAKALTVSDADGPFLVLENARIALHRAALLARRSLTLSITADRIALLRAPNSGPRGQAKPSKPFDPTGLWLREIAVNRLTVGRMEYGAGEKQIAISPDFEARLGLRAGQLPVMLEGDLRNPAGLGKLAQYMPVHISVRAELQPDFKAITLKTLKIGDPAGSLAAQGTLGFGPGGKCDARAEVAIDRLQILTKTRDGTVNAKISCQGLLARPEILVDSRIVLKGVQGVDPITLKLRTEPLSEGIDGSAEIAGGYKNQPFGVNAKFGLHGTIASLADFKGTLPGTAISGAGTYALDSHLANGKIDLVVSRLAALGELAGLPLAGRLSASLEAKGEKTQAVTARIDFDHIVFKDNRIASGTLAASASDMKTMPVDKLDLHLNGVEAAQAVTLPKLDASLRSDGENRLAYTISTAGTAKTYRIALEGKGDIGLTAERKLSELTASPVTFRINDQTLSARGSFSPETVAMKISASPLAISAIAQNLPDRISGTLASGTIDISGRSAAPVIVGDIHMKTASGIVGRERNRTPMPSLAIAASIRYADNRLGVSTSAAGRGIRAFALSAALPMRISLAPFAFQFEKTSPLSGTLSTDLDLGSITTLFLPYGVNLRGSLASRATIGGSVAVPDLDGTIRLTDGDFSQEANGIRLQHLQLDGQFARRRLTIRSLSADDGIGGTLHGSGWAEPFAKPLSVEAHLDIAHMRLLQSAMATAVASAHIDLKPADNGFRVAGSVDIENALINIPERFNSAIPQLNTVDKRDYEDKGVKAGPVIAVDMRVNATNRIFVRGWGLDAEMGGKLHLTGTASALQAFGQFATIRGRFEQFGKQFHIETAELNFQGPIPPSPSLNIKTTIPAGDVTAAIDITGQATKPQLAFSSTPALPQDEVLSRILFGTGAANISPLQAIQLAAALRKFTGDGGGSSLDPIGTLRTLTGLDQLQVDSSDQGGVTVGAGKYITDRVYVEADQGSSAESGTLKVETTVTKNISLESKVGVEKTGAGILYKYDY